MRFYKDTNEKELEKNQKNLRILEKSV